MNPRQRFLLDSPKAKAWADIASSLLFAEVCDVAQLELLSNTTLVSDPELAAAFEQRRQGAFMLVLQLKTLCKVPDAPAQRVSDNLTRV